MSFTITIEMKVSIKVEMNEEWENYSDDDEGLSEIYEIVEEPRDNDDVLDRNDYQNDVPNDGLDDSYDSDDGLDSDDSDDGLDSDDSDDEFGDELGPNDEDGGPNNDRIVPVDIKDIVLDNDWRSTLIGYEWKYISRNTWYNGEGSGVVIQGSEVCATTSISHYVSRLNTCFPIVLRHFRNQEKRFTLLNLEELINCQYDRNMLFDDTRNQNFTSALKHWFVASYKYLKAQEEEARCVDRPHSADAQVASALQPGAISAAVCDLSSPQTP